MSIYLIIVIIVAVYLLCGFISKMLNNKLKKYDCYFCCNGSLFFVPLCNIGCIFCRLVAVVKSKDKIKQKKEQIKNEKFIAKAKAVEEAAKERLKHIIQL